MNEVQIRELGVLKEVIKVINKHNLRYFAIGGTCIGAIRHHGFIPWDDDIDIALPRNDYEKLRNEYYKELPVHIKKLDYDSSESHGYLFAKFHDSRTTFVEHYAVEYPDRFTGSFVDIMPIDGLPINEYERAKVLRKLSKLCSLNSAVRPMKYESKDVVTAFKSIVRVSMRRIFRYNYFSDKIFSLMKNYCFDQANKIAFTWRINDPNCFPKRVVFSKSFFEEVKEVEFEDIMICVPQKFDEYLKQDFGDYMKLPPVEEQNSIHMVSICDMNKPCEYYADKKRKGIAV